MYKKQNIVIGILFVIALAMASCSASQRSSRGVMNSQGSHHSGEGHDHGSDGGGGC